MVSQTRSRTSLPVLLFLLTLIVAAGASSVQATPITAITHLNNFRDTRSLNDVGIGQGDRNQFGADIVPNAGTTITGVQGGFTVGPTNCAGLAVDPNFCAVAPAFSLARTGAWSLTFTNGTNTATATTPTLAGIPAAPVPFPVSVTISGAGTSPTLSWTVPSGFTPDAVRVNVFDKSVTLVNGQKDIIFSTALASTATSFTVPVDLGGGRTLKFGNPYVLNVQLIETRGGLPLVGNFNDNIFRRSSSFFDFTPLSPGTPPSVLLPTVGPAPDPSSGFGPTYEFSVGGIVPGGKIFIDPFLAIGYDYAIGLGNPNFASVLLPAVQTDPFFLSFPGEPSGVPVNLFAGTEFFFPAGGVDRFSVRGIDISDGLDPGNVTAFITGLTFTGSGEFTGTMIPVIAFAASAPVPEPLTLLLLVAGGLGIVGSFARRRYRRL